jgi:hypothetical protein
MSIERNFACTTLAVSGNDSKSRKAKPKQDSATPHVQNPPVWDSPELVELARDKRQTAGTSNRIARACPPQVL